MKAPVIAFLAGLGFAQALPAQSLDALQAYFESVDTLKGGFVQETRDETDTVVESADGDFAISRPGRFDWRYEEPFEQRIVADGRWLYVYDVELDQVTVRGLDRVLGVGPAVLLSGDYANLEENFRMKPGEDGWIELEPKGGDWEFQNVRLRLVDGTPAVVEVEDGLGQTTRLELQELERNVDIDPERLRFSPPEDADLIAPPEYEGEGA